MAVYKYKALSRDGTDADGIIEAKNAAEAIVLLRQSFSIIKDVREVGASDIKKALGHSNRKRINEKNLALICKQFSIIMGAGLPIVRTIELVAAQTEDKTLRAILYDVADDVAAGSGLSDSFEKRGPGFSMTFIETVRAGEETGRLDLAFERLHNYLLKKTRVKSKVISSLTYPSFVIGVAIAVIVIIMIFAVPVFSDTFREMGTELPWPTKLLMAVSDFMTKYGILILAIIAVIVIAILMYNRTEKGKINISKAILKIPLIGKIQYMNAASQFANTFATMIASGIPIMKGMIISGKSLSNRFMGNALLDASKGVEQGYSIGTCLRADGKMPDLLVEMIAVGEESGSLSETLTVIGEYYDNEVDTVTTRAVGLLEPITICVLAVFVMLILLAVYLPLFSMYDSFNGTL